MWRKIAVTAVAGVAAWLALSLAALGGISVQSEFMSWDTYTASGVIATAGSTSVYAPLDANGDTLCVRGFQVGMDFTGQLKSGVLRGKLRHRGAEGWDKLTYQESKLTNDGQFPLAGGVTENAVGGRYSEMTPFIPAMNVTELEIFALTNCGGNINYGVIWFVCRHENDVDWSKD